MGAEIISLLESHARFISMHAGGDNCYNARSNTQTAVTMILWLFHKNSAPLRNGYAHSAFFIARVE